MADTRIVFFLSKTVNIKCMFKAIFWFKSTIICIWRDILAYLHNSWFFSKVWRTVALNKTGLSSLFICWAVIRWFRFYRVQATLRLVVWLWNDYFCRLTPTRDSCRTLCRELTRVGAFCTYMSANRPGMCKKVNWPLWNNIGCVENDAKYTTTQIWK